MNTEREPVPPDDAIAAGLRAALERTVTEEPPGSIEWTTVLSRARRAVFLRRVVATSSLAVVLIVGVTAVALASTSGHRRSGVVVIATATTSDAESATTSTVAPTSTTVLHATSTVPTGGPCTTCTSTSTAASPLPAQPGDFSGRLDHWGDSCGPCHPGDGKNLQLTLRNVTSHDINLSPSAPVRVALICATNMTPDGGLTAPLPSGGIDTFVDEAVDASGNSVGTADTLAPGAQATTVQWGYAINAVGTLTCEGAIVSSSDGTWRNETLSVVSRLTNIATYSVEVTDASSTTAPTSTSAPPESTTTSVP